MLDRPQAPEQIDVRSRCRCASIRVCEVTAFGGPEVLRIGERPRPAAGAGEVVVRIAGDGCQPDRRRRARRSPPPAGCPELAAAVRARAGTSPATIDELAGPLATRFETSAAVVGMIPWVQAGGRVGAYAQAAARRSRSWLVPRPARARPGDHAATVPLNALTARQALDLIAAPPGSTLLITGASGAVGGLRHPARRRATGCGCSRSPSDGDEEWVARPRGDRGARPFGASIARAVDALLDAVPSARRLRSRARRRGGGVHPAGRGPARRGRAARSRLRLSNRIRRAGRARRGSWRAVGCTLGWRGRSSWPTPPRPTGSLERGGLRGKIVLAPDRPLKEQRWPDRAGPRSVRRRVVLGARAAGPAGRRPRGRGGRPPGPGEDPTPVAEVSLDAYADRVCSVLADGPPAVLVGHSMGGMVDHAGGRTLSGRTSRRWSTSRPSCPPTGRAWSTSSRCPRRPDDQVQANLVVDGDPPVATDARRGGAGSRSTAAATTSSWRGRRSSSARSRWRRSRDRVSLGGAGAEEFAALPRAYVTCLAGPRDPARDAAPDVRRGRGCDPVIEIDTDHSPWVSRTDRAGGGARPDCCGRCGVQACASEDAQALIGKNGCAGWLARLQGRR